MNISRLSVLEAALLATLVVGCGEQPKQPVTPEDFLGVLEAKLAAGDLVAAQDAWGKLGEDLSSAADALLLGGELAWHQRDYATAAERFAKVAENPELDKALRSLGWNGLGVIHKAEGKRDVARCDFLKAKTLDGKNPAARYHLGMLYRDDFGYREAALEQFEFYVRINQLADERVQRVQRSVIKDLKEEIATAAAARPGVEKRNSTVSAAALKKGDEAFRKGTFKTARTRYQEAFDADVLSFPAAQGLARCWAKLDSSAAGSREAFKYYRIACELSPMSVSTLLAAGELAVKVGSHAAAVEIYSRAMAANPRNTTAIDGLIRALRKVGKPDSAAEYQRYRDFLKK